VTTEDSTQSALDRLNQKRARVAAEAPADDSGLIDLDRLTRALDAGVASKPAKAGFAAPPPLQVTREEATLRAVSAVRVEQPRSRRWLAGYAAIVALLGAGLGFLLDDAFDDPGVQSAPPATIVVVAPAPTDAPSAPRVERPAATNVATARPTGTSPPRAEPNRNPRARTEHRTRPGVGPSKPAERADPPRRTDPCADCNGDLACAMRCSVRSNPR
jgi:hypothetical protein